MDQKTYEIIVACIQHGAPALEQTLVSAFNNVIHKANELAELKRVKDEEARKAEIAKAEKAREEQKVTKVTKTN